MRPGILRTPPENTLELYEFAACPSCCWIREAPTVPDLEAIIHPCPKNGSRFRQDIITRGGNARFPYFLDPNTGTEMYESDETNRYLFQHYGSGGVSLTLAGRPLTNLEVFTNARVHLNSCCKCIAMKAHRFAVWSGETLCELELPYWLHDIA